MLSNKRRLAYPAAIVGAAMLFSAVPAGAEEAFPDWGAVPAEELAEERGMAIEVDEDALAAAIGAQYQTVSINGDVIAPGGDNLLGTHSFDSQVMSLNIINSGHNNVFQAQNVIAVTIVDGAPQ